MFLVVLIGLLAACSTSTPDVVQQKIALPKDAPDWIRENILHRGMFEGHYVTFREEGPEPDALIMLRDFGAEELLVSLLVDEDTTRIRWMTFNKPIDKTISAKSTLLQSKKCRYGKENQF